MVRRVVKEHEVRRNELLDISQKLFIELGYEATTINAILEVAGVAKGTFYHYFKSKEDLLDALVARITVRVLEEIRRRISRPGLGALEKFNLFFEASSSWKTANLTSLRSILRPMMSDENVHLRHRMHRRNVEMIGPDVVGIVRQGIEEGVFDTAFPDESAEMMMGLGNALQEGNARLILGMDGDPAGWDILLRRIVAFQDALERLLGAPRGSLRVTTESSLEAYRLAAGSRS